MKPVNTKTIAKTVREALDAEKQNRRNMADDQIVGQPEGGALQ
jgi:hypothetical protein